MTIFDLLFIAVFLTSLGTLCTAAVLAIRGRGKRAVRILRIYGLCIAAYFGIIIVTSLLLPRRVLNVGEPLCADDWCIGVEKVDRTPAGSGTRYHVTFRLHSRARRVSQRENGVRVYIADDQGRRFFPAPDDSTLPFNALLQPQESVFPTRSFQLPPDAREPGLVILRSSGFPIGWFIIGYDTWFRKPAMVRLPGR